MKINLAKVNGDGQTQPETQPEPEVGSPKDSLVCDVCTESDMADHLISCMIGAK